MTFTFPEGTLDRLFPFAVSCDADLAVEHVGPALRKVVGDVTGRGLLEVFSIDRPPGIGGPNDVREREGEAFLLRSRETGAVLRCQPAVVDGGRAIVFAGSLLLEEEADLERFHVVLGDFAPADPTPDALILKRVQEHSLRDLDTLNRELRLQTRELRARNRELEFAERRYRQLVEQLPLVTYIDRLDDVSSNVYTSPQITEMLGYPVDEWTADPGLYVNAIHPDDREEVLAEIIRTNASGERFVAEYRLIAADGRVVWVRDDAITISDTDGRPLFAQGYLLDITAQKEGEHELHAYSSRLAALIAGMQAGVLVEDGQRRVVLANSQFCEIFGIPVPPDALVGSDCAAAAEQARTLLLDPERWTARIQEILRAGEPVQSEDVEFADGRVFDRDYLPVHLNGESVGHLWIYRDVTDRRRSERELARARDDAAAASQAKSDFLATMSHEIRTPMHGVLGTIDLLGETVLDAEQHELVEIIRTSAGALLELINDILDLQKIESGTVELTEEAFDVAAVVTGVADLLRPSADAQGLDLRIEIDPALPSPLIGDAKRLRQVLVNLAGNAVKFTSAGRVTLRAASTLVDGRDARVRISVEDTGPGIPEEMQKDVFTPFVQLPGSETRGTGLGLAICDRLVRLMGGTIDLDSEPGRGTCVTVDLCLPIGSLGEAAIASGSSGAWQPRIGTTVLVAEDNEVNRELALRQLARLGVMARAVSDGEQAVEAVRAGHPYDLLLMDVQMPGLDGLEATGKIRELEAATDRSHLAIVAMTANALPGDRRRCLAAGMDDYVTKPLTLDHLREVLARWLPREEKRPQPPADDVEAALGRLLEDLGDAASAAHVVGLWLEQLGPRLDRIRAAVRDDDAEATAAAAHDLKSTSAIVGAYSMAHAAGALELRARRDGAVDRASFEALERGAEAAAAAVRNACAALGTR